MIINFIKIVKIIRVCLKKVNNMRKILKNLDLDKIVSKKRKKEDLKNIKKD